MSYNFNEGGKVECFFGVMVVYDLFDVFGVNFFKGCNFIEDEGCIGGLVVMIFMY